MIWKNKTPQTDFQRWRSKSRRRWCLSQKSRKLLGRTRETFFAIFLRRKKEESEWFFILLVTLAKRLVNSDRKKIKKIVSSYESLRCSSSTCEGFFLRRFLSVDVATTFSLRLDVDAKSVNQGCVLSHLPQEATSLTTKKPKEKKNYQKEIVAIYFDFVVLQSPPLKLY